LQDIDRRYRTSGVGKGGASAHLWPSAKPSDLRVEPSTKLLLTINLKNAKTRGLTVLPSLIACADEDIE
jgi:hypothetical protein